MKAKMRLLSDTIFGNGMSIPGGEDIAVLCDDCGFPYYKGGSFKGIFREELQRYLTWSGKDAAEARKITDCMLGRSSDDNVKNRKMFFSDFVLSDGVKAAMLEEIGNHPSVITDALSNVRTFTSINESGTAKEGSLRMARCINCGIEFESEITCEPQYEELVKDVLPMIKWVGSMRNRGFGKVRITVE